jgi:Transposase DDE domain group 1
MVIVPKKTPRRNRRKSRRKSRARDREILRQRRRKILDRIKNQPAPERDVPMITAANIHYELGERVHGLSDGGIGAMVLPARNTGLISLIDSDLHLLKRHLPYHESDHVLNIALNIIAGGRCLEHIERRRNDAVFLDALQAVRIPDPTTEGDFCRRSHESDVLDLLEAINKARLRVWSQQPADFFREAIIDVDGTLVGTDAECKEGVDIAYDGTRGYHPLVVSLANTGELLYLVNRSGNRPSHEQAPTYIDKTIALCRRAGFERIYVRGDTDFSQTEHLDRWDAPGDIRSLFGFDANSAPVARAAALPAEAYCFLERSPRYEIKTAPRDRPDRVKAEIVRQRGFVTIHTLEEMVAEFEYQPWACRRPYRAVVLRKRLGIAKGGVRLREEYRYFFFITHDRDLPVDAIVLQANDRCNQENLVAQLKGGVHALTSPVDDLVSNWAYMVMASLAWALKVWAALMLPEEPRHAEAHGEEKQELLRMEFATFRAAMIEMPCQLVRTGGRLIYRLLSWNPWQGAFLRLVERLQGCWPC